MADTRMTSSERDRFLAKPFVGVISIEHTNPDRPPVSSPIWYDYDPAIGVWILTGPRSVKGKALHTAQAYTMVVQDETPPYRYVSVSGPIIEERPADRERDLRPMAHRYSDTPEAGDAYADSYPDGGFGHVYVMEPRYWLTNDNHKMKG